MGRQRALGEEARPARPAGHTAGMDADARDLRATDDWGIRAQSVYAFSTENWGRAPGQASEPR